VLTLSSNRTEEEEEEDDDDDESFEAFTAVMFQVVFWVVTSCSFVEGYQRFRCSC
jgi:hypothetical protein